MNAIHNSQFSIPGEGDIVHTFRDLLNENADKYPGKPATLFGGKVFTFCELNERVNQLANALTDLGVRKGDRIGMLAYNCSQYVEFFGLAKAGFICVPLNYRCVGRELVYLIDNAEVNSLIFENEFAELLGSIRSEISRVHNFICLDANPENCVEYEKLIEGYPAAEPKEVLAPDDPCILFYSSGTTGRPKAAIHTHRSILAETRVPYRDLSSEEVALCVMPFFHVGGAAAHLFPALAAGATLVIQKKFDETQVLEAIAREKVTYVYLVPAMILRVLEHPQLSQYDIRSLHTICYTGAPMPIHALKNGIAHLGPVFIQFLGQTETLDLTVLRKDEHKLNGSAKEMKRLESTGRPPHPGELRIVDELGRDVSVGDVGEIVAQSDRMMRGYWKAPAETAETIKDGWLHTGDLGYVDDDGYVYIVDRKKDMIISGAENIYSREVEEVLYKHPAILEAAVIGVPDEKWGESVKAIVALKAGVTACEEEIIAFCKGYLASYKKPRSVEFWDSLPKTASGKIKKSEIREQYWRGRAKRVH